ILVETEFAVFREVIANGGQVRGIRVEGGASYSRRIIDELTEVAKKAGARGLAWAALESAEVRSSFARFLAEGERAAMIERLEGRQARRARARRRAGGGRQAPVSCGRAGRGPGRGRAAGIARRHRDSGLRSHYRVSDVRVDRRRAAEGRRTSSVYLVHGRGKRM